MEHSDLSHILQTRIRLIPMNIQLEISQTFGHEHMAVTN